MKYVLDASVALKWVLKESDWAIAAQLRVHFDQGIHELIAPDVFGPECGHALARAERKKVIDPGESTIHLADIITSLPRLYESVPLLNRAAALASAHRTSFYDCLYVALAEREQCDLLTADAKVARVLTGFPIVLLSALSR